MPSTRRARVGFWSRIASKSGSTASAAGGNAFELFDLTRLDEAEEHARLSLILSADNFLGGATEQLLRDTDSAYKDVTDHLYRQYKELRERLVAFLTGSADGPKLGALRAIEIAQKILDRILFIAFAQRTDLLPDRLLEDAARSENKFVPQPIWMNFLGLFRALDRGNERLVTRAYNGGLLAHDAVADTLILPDHLAQDIAQLGQWDYRREVPVTVLGHIFEQSITDIETLKAEGKGEAPPLVSRRKREGVVYTPDTITRFLVERTVGVSLDERRRSLWKAHGMPRTDAGDLECAPEVEVAFWEDYLSALRNFTIVDPACGSGAFLVAAFDEMARRYRATVGRLGELGVEAGFDIFDEIVTKNLYGVDLNPESVEITRLPLWLKTARRDHRLQNLEATIRCGNSLIADKAYCDRPFDWHSAFAAVFAAGGFDVVIGNPPYVRMEHIKAIKPYLEEHYIVAADRADLYAYFFEQGVALLRDGGRLGYISSSTFFRTGSGQNLRGFLTDKACVESIVDFGDLQIFEGVTTYPAILTVRKKGDDQNGHLSFLTIDDRMPDDLGRAIAERESTMPRVRLGRGAWRLEGDAVARLRDKIAVGRSTLGEVYGQPMRGIVTGLNEAFVIDRKTRDRLAETDPKSADVLETFLRGENIRRWRVESEDLFLINTPKGKVDIAAYPAVRNWLSQFRAELENRATRQEWWELQQAQLAYQPKLREKKIAWPHFQDDIAFSLDDQGYFLNNKCFFLEANAFWLLALLNAKCTRFQLFSIARAKRGGFIEAEAQYVAQLVMPEIDPSGRRKLTELGQTATEAANDRAAIRAAVRHRIIDLAPSDRRKITARLEAWHQIDFAAFQREIKRAFRADIPVRQRADWESYLADATADVRRFAERIDAAEREIDVIVYRIFDLTPQEIAVVEGSIGRLPRPS